MNHPCTYDGAIDVTPQELRILLDARLIRSHPRYLGTPPRNVNMRVPVEIAKSVVFIGRIREMLDPDKRDKLAGTGFVVSIDGRIKGDGSHCLSSDACRSR